MRRRRFLEIAGSGIALASWLEEALSASEGSAPTDGVVGESTEADIRSLFEANGEEVLALAEGVFRKCILEKLRPPVLAQNDLGEPIFATPAVAEEALYLRTAGPLCALGGPEERRRND